MSPIRLCPPVSDSKEPLVKVVVAFLEQVLRIDKASILDVSYETTVPAYPPVRKYFQQEYAVTVKLFPASALGETIYLGMESQGEEYVITKLLFQPGWKPQEGQA